MKKQNLITCLTLSLMLFFAINAFAMSSTNYTLDKDVISGGGGGSSSTSYNNTSTTAQSSAIGASSSASYSNYAGFWYAVAAIMPDISASPPSLNFSDVNVNTTSLPQEVTLTNTGTADLHTSGVEMSGANAGMFSATGGSVNPCNPSITLTPGSSCTLSFTFTPSSAGAKTAAFTVYSDAVNDPDLEIPLSGTGVGQPNILPSAASLTFGDVNVNTTSSSQTVTFTNTGTADLNVSNATLTGTDAGMFTVTGGAVNPCNPTIALTPDSYCTLAFTFTPTSTGSKTATFSVYSDDPDTAQLDIPLSGIGISISQYTLTVGKTGTGFGTVTSEPGGINCSTDCSEVYTSGTIVTLSPAPDTGSKFTGWTGCDSVTGNTCDITMNTDKAVTAEFIPSALYVVWQDDTLTPGNMDIFMKKSTDNGVTWTWQQISNNAGNSQLPMLAVDNTNAVYVVWQDDTFGNNDIFMKKSTDNGVTWTWQQISNNAGNSQLPMLAVDNTNAVYVVWQDDTFGNNDIFMKKSTDNGVTWAWQQISNNAGNSQLPVLAVDNSNAVYVVWQDDTLTPGNNDIFMKKSTDGGVTWTWQQISNNAGNSQLPMITVDNTNAVYVVWQDNTLGNNDIYMKKSTDNGVTWTWQQISNNAGNSQSPVLAVDNSNAVYVVWQDDTLTPGNSDIFMKKSTDNGVTWTWQQISTNAGNSQMPKIAVDNTNAVYVVWQDNTLGSNDIYMKKSTDNGVTWTWQQISNNAGNSIMPALVK